MAHADALVPAADRLASHAAVQHRFSAIRDIIPGDDAAIALRSVPGDARRPLTFGRLQRFFADFDVARFGIAQGSRLCISLPNGPEAAVAFLAASLYCTCAPLNVALTAAEVAFEFEDMPASACIAQRGEDNTIVLAECVRLHVPLLELVPSTDVVGEFTLGPLATEIGALPAAVSRELSARSDVALVLHTSGTTAKPKVVPLHHENLVVGALQIAACLQLDGQRSVNLNVMPLYHIHAISINLLASLVAGAQCVAAPGPQADRLLTEWLSASPRPTWYSSVPTIHGLLLRSAEAMGLDAPGAIVHSLLFARSESSMLPLPIGRALERLFDLSVSQTYAMTESMPIANNPVGPSRKLHSVGPAAGPEIRICEDEGASLSRGAEGEVCVRGACVTVGYELRAHMASDPNVRSFHADAGPMSRLAGAGVWVRYDPARAWLRTGDKGFVDEDGHVNLVGRFKEIINRGGEKISPFEVEHVLLAHHGVQDMLVFAVPHAQLGEVVGVAAVPCFPCTLTLAELRTYGASRGLAPKWLPEALVFIDAVPKGTTGKPARIGLATKLGMAELDATAEGNMVDGGGAAEAPLPNAHISGIVAIVVEAVLVYHFCPHLTARNSAYAYYILSWLAGNYGGMMLLFIASGVTTHLAHVKVDPASSCSAYSAFAWGRSKRLLLVAYLSQWSMLVAATRHPPAPAPAEYGDLNGYIFDALPLVLSILLPTCLLAMPLDSVLYSLPQRHGTFMGAIQEAYTLNSPAWFASNLLLLWLGYPFASRGLRLVERHAGSGGLLTVALSLVLLSAVAFQGVGHGKDAYLVWHSAPPFLAGSTIAALAVRHDALAGTASKKTDGVTTAPPTALSRAWMWACAHHATLRGLLADLVVVAVALQSSYSFAYQPQRELEPEVTSWEYAWWRTLASALFLAFFYGSCADGGAGLVARGLRHPLLGKLSEYAIALYMWQELWFLGVFHFPFAYNFPLLSIQAQGERAVLYVLPQKDVTPSLLDGGNLAAHLADHDLAGSLDALRFVAALLGIHVFAVAYVEWLEVPLLSVTWRYENVWWWRPFASL